jgi:CRP-like cAMP-binding protein
MNNLETIDLFLRKVPLFSWLSTESISWLAHNVDVLSIKEGEIIFPKESLSDALYFIAEGEVTFISGDTSNPDEQTATTLEVNELFGELCLLQKQPRQALARAALPSTLYKINASIIARFAQENEDQHAILLTNLARELARKIRILNTQKSLDLASLSSSSA